MKKTIGIIGLWAMLMLITASVFAGPPQRLRVTIPFDFYIQDQLMPSGEYIFVMRPVSAYASSASSIAVLKSDGTAVATILTNPGNTSLSDEHLHFTRYGNRAYLTKVENMGLQANVLMSKGERILHAQVASSQAKVAAVR
jgi:hypothetical protein